ncbi:MAG TPA: type IV toxin-antitoxin system AbiEi family antitoxin [Myxococcota bacterium]|nr:type IV toxin-antitoxin system AbiEi family antitoxin [Myxococcota bacterium]
MADQTAAFLATNPVFSLGEAIRALTPEQGSEAARKRLKWAATKGRVKRIARGFFASVPPGLRADRFEPDRYLVAAALRPDAVFAYHAGFELLGAAHSDWNRCIVFTEGPRRPLDLGSVRIEFLLTPSAFRGRPMVLGLRSVDRDNRTLRVTGPERTLLDALRHPDLAGGLSEAMESAAGFGVLDLELLHRLLEIYSEKRLWAATGWFLERFQRTFFVPEALLAKFEGHRSDGRQYLVRRQRGGTLVSRWNLIVPKDVDRFGDPSER